MVGAVVVGAVVVGALLVTVVVLRGWARSLGSRLGEIISDIFPPILK